MAKGKAVENKLAVVDLSSGESYLGFLGENEIVDAFRFTGGTRLDRVFEEYLKQRNLGSLGTVKFSAVTAYTVTNLTEEEEAEWNHVSGLFALAQRKAKAFNENNCFDRLYAKK